MALTQAQQMVQRYIEAELAVLDGRTFTLRGRTLGREDLGKIREGRQEWERRVAAEQAGRAGASILFTMAEFP